MTTLHRTDSTRRRLAAALCTALLVPAAAQAVRVDYRVGVGVEYDDNVTLSEHDPVSETILQPSLGFRISEDGSAVQAYVDGLLDYNDYLGGKFSNEFRSQINGRLNWSALPERLDLVVEDVLGVQPVNPLAANTPSNLQQTNVLSVGPSLRFQLSPALRGLAEFRFIDSRAEKTDFFDAHRYAGALRIIRDVDPNNRLSANLEAERIDFAHGDIAGYDRYSAYARWARTLRDFDFGVDLGYVQLDGNAPLGSHGKPLLRADVGWHPDADNTLTLRARHQYTDAASSMIAALDTRVIPPAGAPIPTGIVTGGTVVSSSPYLEEHVELDWTWQGATTSFGAAPFWQRWRYVLPNLLDVNDLDQNSHGVNLFANRTLRPGWNLGGFATWESVDYRNLDRRDRNGYIGLFLTHLLSRHWSWRLELSHYERDSNTPGMSSRSNIVFFGVAWTR